MNNSAEQEARDLMEQCGWEDAQSCSAGEVVFLANKLREMQRLREQRNKLAEYARRLWAASCYEWGDEFQGIGEELGVCELRPVVPGSDDAEEWGEDAELYYLAPWVIGGEDE